MEPGASKSKSEAAPARKKSPRLGIIVRLLIYVPLLGFFGWQAAQRFIDGRNVADDNFHVAIDAWINQPREELITLPNGKTGKVRYVTPEQAMQEGLLAPPPAPAAEHQPDPSAPE